MTSINWLAFPLVFVAALTGAAIVVVLFATAIRLFATPPRGARPAGAARGEEMDDVGDPTRPRSATAGGIVLFVLAGAAVLYGIYLIVPFLHK